VDYGCRSEVNEIKSLLLKHPREAFITQENIDDFWVELNYLGRPDFEKAVEEYENFVVLLQKFVPEIHYLPQNENTGLDSIYVHDPVMITDRGAILCRMGKGDRMGEPEAAGEFLKERILENLKVGMLFNLMNKLWQWGRDTGQTLKEYGSSGS
jgi:arginine deiminase